MVKKETQYYEGIGRRKSAIARVRITPAAKTTYSVNNKELAKFFGITAQTVVVKQPFEAVDVEEKFAVSVHVSGGGMTAQSEAIRLGIARALEKFEPKLRGDLKKAGYLKRDPRVVERKKFGLRKARRAPQWSKR
jgi:small subunit ribosomal protein S9